MRYLPLITPEDLASVSLIDFQERIKAAVDGCTPEELAKAVVVVESETRWAGTKGEELEISVCLRL